MSKRFLTAMAGAGALAVTALTAGVNGAQAASPHLTHLSGLHAKRVCAATPAAGHATCLSKVMVNKKGAVPMASEPLASALTPTQLRAAYSIPTGGTSGTVAIVDAYGYPNLERDLGIFRSKYGMNACTTSNGCLKIVNQTGGSTPPSTDVGWSQEQALDVDAVSAACPACHILVVQANSASFADLGTAVKEAAKPAYGVAAISNSYGGSDAPDSTYGSYYDHPGIAVTASTGDNGYKGGSYPASSSYVTAVGGTTLKMSGTNRTGETAWSGAGSGCSSYNTAIPGSSAFNTGCSRRAMADVSAAADPNYGGLSVYAPTTATSSTWSQYGGTSESSPIIASMYALAPSFTGYSNAIPYAHSSALRDITSGRNAHHCPTSQWCTARTGWDGPTGLGVPNGTGAF